MLLKVLVALILLSELVDAAVKMGLKRHELEGGKLLKQEKFFEYHAVKRQRHIQKTRAGRFATGKSGLTNSYDWIYVAEVSVGTPPQTFHLFPDTKSISTWIADSSMFDDLGPDDEYCAKNPCFKSSASSTYIKDDHTFVGYFNGSVYGVFGTDTFQIGDNTQKLTLLNVTFGQAQNKPFFLEDVPLDGVLGLAFQSVPNEGVEPIFATAIREKVVDKPIFTIWINNPASKNENHGQVTWGDFDSEHCSSEIAYFPLIDKTNFVFQLDGYSINDGKKEAANWKAVSDPALPFIYIPDRALRDFVKIVNASYDFSNDQFEVDCNVKFSWTVYAGDKALKIDEKVGVVQNKFNNEKCLLGIDSSYEENYDVVLGESFLKEWCAVHDISGKGQIGYARSK